MWLQQRKKKQIFMFRKYWHKCVYILLVTFAVHAPPVYTWMPKSDSSSMCFCFMLRCARSFQVSGCAFDPLCFFFFLPQFSWLSTLVCDPHYNPEIKYTSKQLKLNKIKCVCRHRGCMLIEHSCICLLMSRSATNLPPFIYLNVLSYSYEATSSLFSLLPMHGRCYLDEAGSKPLMAASIRRPIFFKAAFSASERSSAGDECRPQREKETAQLCDFLFCGDCADSKQPLRSLSI